MRAELSVPGRYRLHALPVHARANWWQLFVDWIGGWWNSLARRFIPHVHFGTRGADLAGDVIVVLCVALIAFAALRLMMAIQLAKERRARVVPIGRSSHDAHRHFTAAITAAGEGRYAGAVRALFAATVELLDVRGVLHDERSATVNDLRGLLRQRNRYEEIAFSTIARIYTDAAYAERPIDAALWQAARTAYDALAREQNREVTNH